MCVFQRIDFRKLIPRDMEAIEGMLSRPYWTTFDRDMERRGVPGMYYRTLKHFGIVNLWQANLLSCAWDDFSGELTDCWEMLDDLSPSVSEDEQILDQEYEFV